jgi:nickel-dependent lactate racemase
MQAPLLYGQDTIKLTLPDSARLLDPKEAPALDDPGSAVIEALNRPIGGAPLSELAKGRKNACLVISDITRPVPNQVILLPMLKVLEDAGMKREEISILIATGMHRPNEGEELEYMVGAEIMNNYRILNHFCRKDEDMRLVAEMDGAPIELNRHYLDADLKIITGLIEPHMYAGYSGGRKALLPGISSFRTMQYMHSFKMIDHPKVTNCVLEGNPFHQAGERVCELAGVDFMLNVVINKDRETVGVYAGHYSQAHLAGCAEVASHAVHTLEEPADLVITSAGGYPLDATFYQVSKGLIMAKNMVKPTGAIVIAAECREGFGSPEYCQLIDAGHGWQRFFDEMSQPDNFVIDQWCLQTTYQALHHTERIYVYSGHLSHTGLEGMGFSKVDDLQACVDSLLPQSRSVVAVPQGPYVVGLVA